MKYLNLAWAIRQQGSQFRFAARRERILVVQQGSGGEPVSRIHRKSHSHLCSSYCTFHRNGAHGVPHEAHPSAKPKAPDRAGRMDHLCLRLVREIARCRSLGAKGRNWGVVLGGMPRWNRNHRPATGSASFHRERNSRHV
jgi:hypothetical protein